MSKMPEPPEGCRWVVRRKNFGAHLDVKITVELHQGNTLRMSCYDYPTLRSDMSTAKRLARRILREHKKEEAFKALTTKETK